MIICDRFFVDGNNWLDDMPQKKCNGIKFIFPIWWRSFTIDCISKFVPQFLPFFADALCPVHFFIGNPLYGPFLQPVAPRLKQSPNRSVKKTLSL